LETRVAVQITANAAWRNGATKTADLPEVAPVAVLIAKLGHTETKKNYIFFEFSAWKQIGRSRV
jgi:hypothetical protein